MKLDVKTLNVDDYILYFNKRIRLGDLNIETPIKALDPGRIKGTIPFNSNIRGINEIYKRLNESSLQKILYDSNKQDTFNWYLNSALRKSKRNELNILIQEFEGNRYPKTKELEFIMDTSYSYSDIVTLPIISGIKQEIKNEKSFKKYINIIKEAIEIVETHNNKSVMGIVPPIVAPYIPELIDFYCANGIYNYIFDFDGKTPLSMRQNVRGFIRTLINNNVLENCYVHSINLNYGRFNKEASSIGGKDILSFGMGFDCLGERHKPLRLPQEFFKKMGERKEQRLRLFNKNDYGYYRLKAMQIEKIYPKDSKVNISLFNNRKVKIEDVQRTFNIEQLGMESLRIRKKIKENSMQKYISKKSQVNKKDLNQIERIKKDVTGPKQQKLKID